MHFFDLLSDWAMFALGLPVTGLGFILLTDEFKKFKAARVSFYIAAIWTWGKIVMWGIHSPDKFVERAIIIFIASGLVAVGLVEVLRLTTKREIPKELAQTQGENIKPPEPEHTPAGHKKADVPAPKVHQTSTGAAAVNQQQSNSGGINTQQSTTGSNSPILQRAHGAAIRRAGTS